MAVVNVMPNGYLILTMSPRESLYLTDQLLDPEEYPWGSMESQMLAAEVKSKIKAILEQSQFNRVEQLKQFMPPPGANDEPPPNG